MNSKKQSNGLLLDSQVCTPRNSQNRHGDKMYTPYVAIDPLAQGNIIDRSGVIAHASQSQVLLPANPDRHGFWVQNQSAGYLYINELGAADNDNGSLRIAPGGLYEPAPGGLSAGVYEIFGETQDAIFAAREW